MPGVNYMGGKRNAAKARSKDAVRRMQKTHFGRQRLQNYLAQGPRTAKERADIERVKPIIELGHAHRDHDTHWGALSWDRPATHVIKYDHVHGSSPGPSSMPSKILEALDKEEPMAFRSVVERILDIPDLLGVHKSILRPKRLGSSSDAEEDLSHPDSYDKDSSISGCGDHSATPDLSDTTSWSGIHYPSESSLHNQHQLLSAFEEHQDTQYNATFSPVEADEPQSYSDFDSLQPEMDDSHSYDSVYHGDFDFGDIHVSELLESPAYDLFDYHILSQTPAAYSVEQLALGAISQSPASNPYSYFNFAEADFLKSPFSPVSYPPSSDQELRENLATHEYITTSDFPSGSPTKQFSSLLFVSNPTRNKETPTFQDFHFPTVKTNAPLINILEHENPWAALDAVLGLEHCPQNSRTSLDIRTEDRRGVGYNGSPPLTPASYAKRDAHYYQHFLTHDISYSDIPSFDSEVDHPLSQEDVQTSRSLLEPTSCYSPSQSASSYGTTPKMIQSRSHTESPVNNTSCPQDDTFSFDVHDNHSFTSDSPWAPQASEPGLKSSHNYVLQDDTNKTAWEVIQPLAVHVLESFSVFND